MWLYFMYFFLKLQRSFMNKIIISTFFMLHTVFALGTDVDITTVDINYNPFIQNYLDAQKQVKIPLDSCLLQKEGQNPYGIDFEETLDDPPIQDNLDNELPVSNNFEQDDSSSKYVKVEFFKATCGHWLSYDNGKKTSLKHHKSHVNTSILRSRKKECGKAKYCRTSESVVGYYDNDTHNLDIQCPECFMKFTGKYNTLRSAKIGFSRHAGSCVNSKK